MIPRRQGTGRLRKSKRRRGVLHYFAPLLRGCLLGFIAVGVGILVYTFLFKAEIFDEAAMVQARRIVFEEPYAPIHEVQAQPPVIQEPSPPSPAVADKDRLPLVAIIIDDMGFHQKIGNELISLPLQLTFSFLPFAPYTREQEETAYAAGHTVLLHLPMQPQNAQYQPGPGALHIGDSAERQERIFVEDLAWVPHAVGVNNHMGSLYTENEAAMRRLVGLIGARGLFFVDSLTTPKSVAYRVAMDLGVKTAKRQIFLDNVHSDEQIRLQLEKLVEFAEQHGKAIGIGHPYPETLQALAESIPVLSARVKVVGARDLVE